MSSYKWLSDGEAPPLVNTVGWSDFFCGQKRTSNQITGRYEIRSSNSKFRPPSIFGKLKLKCACTDILDLDF